MSMRLRYRLVFLGIPVLLFLVLQAFDQEIIFRRETFLLFGVIELLLACLLRPSSLKQIAVYVVPFVVLLTIYLVPFTPRKAFLLKFQDVSVGDSLETVQAKLGGYTVNVIEDNGKQARAQVLHWEVSGDEAYDADVAVFYFEDGFVTKKEFLSD